MEEPIKTIDISQRLFFLMAGFIIFIALFMMGQIFYQFQSLPQNFPQEISVSGEGKVYAKPDIALISLGARIEGMKSQDVVDKNNKIMEAVINSIKELGIDGKDIQTTIYNLMPVYDYTEAGRIFKGYSLDQQIQIKVRDFNKINNILDRATVKGANVVGDLQFTVDDVETIRSEARAKAILQAKEKATSLFTQAGLKIEKLVNIYEESFPFPSPLYRQGFVEAEVEKSVAPQIQTGQLDITASVVLIYRVR